MDNNPLKVDPFFHEDPNTVCYVVSDPSTKKCAIVDVCLDFDQASGRTATTFAEGVRDFVRAEGLAVELIMETHIHADHLSPRPSSRRSWAARSLLARTSRPCRRPGRGSSTSSARSPPTASSSTGY